MDSDQFGTLRLSMFTSLPKKNFPKLKGRVAELKGLGTPLLNAWDKWISKRDPQHVQVLLLLQASTKLENCLAEHRGLDKHPIIMAEGMLSNALDFLNLATALAGHYNARGVMLWNITPKVHSF